MKKTLIILITIYQNFIASFLKQLVGANAACRFSTTCSEYAKQSILRKGVVKGGIMATIRLLKCQPFYNKAI